MGYCVKCREKWSGLRRAHCTACHRTFNSTGGFDDHRKNGKCLDPEDLGMELRDGIWARPMPESAILAISAREI